MAEKNDVRIRALPTAVANQIAAGEVIENPASVVKELLENSLDSKANSIAIDIGFGGLNQIKISDNGTGIMAEDLPLAIAPHATSKLSQLSDLATLTSMGFRGEALASIASVSRLTLSSKPATQENAMMLLLDGTSVELSPCARNQGTTVDVRDLFYNAPVRRRFLKSERSEYLAIEQVVKRFALSAPAIALTLKHNDKPIFELPAATDERTLHLRIKKLLGQDFIENSITLDVERAGMHLKGWISGPAYQRSQNDKQWIYLNQRMIKDKLIHHALKQAYEGRLYPGKHFACLLYLSIPTAEVDVNVHPTKHEVRFQQPRLVHDFLGSQLIEALSHTETTPHPPFGHLLPDSGEKGVLILQENYVQQPLFAISPANESRIIPWVILNKQFGLLTWKETPYLFDLHKAQLEYYRFLLNQQARPLLSRPLLVPIPIDYPIKDADRLQQLLARYGIHLEEKESRYIVRTIPICMPQLNVNTLFKQLLETSVTETELIAILAQHQLVDATQWSADQKEALGHFVIQQLEAVDICSTNLTTPTFRGSSAESMDPADEPRGVDVRLKGQPIPSYCLCLNIERCQELMYANA